MQNKKQLILFIILILLFFSGIFKLFMLRFESGDIYPAYSSLRSDPLGTKAFYAGIEHLSSISIKRNFSPFSRLAPERPVTLLYLGVQQDSYNKKTLDFFDQTAKAGSRVIISFFPTKETIDPDKEKPDEKDTETTDTKKNDNTCPIINDEKNVKDKSELSDKCQTICSIDTMTSYWGFKINYEETESDLGTATGVLPLDGIKDSSLSWHSTLYFDQLDDDWHIVYTQNNHPVIIEKKLGKGTIVISADSYFFSNEAMRNERQAAILSWCLGNNTDIIFDESHFGINKHMGVAGLAREYGLHWLIFGMILFACLFVWKNVSYFVPPPDDSLVQKNSHSSSKNNIEGLISLLRRNLNKNDLINICIDEWKKSFVSGQQTNPETKEKLNKITAMVNAESMYAGKQIHIVTTYQHICQILSKRKRI